jgi:threonyl-tRNA synthetase
MKVFGFSDVGIELSTRPAKSIGSDRDWELATNALEESLKDMNLAYDINAGDGAFYGPKIDIKLKDALRRKWQCATIQCDFALPKRFNLEYIDTDGTAKQPIMLHRVLLGSIERFIACLIEHYAAELPLWLAPIQAVVIPLKEDFLEYASKVRKVLEDNGIRVQIDTRNETLNKKIRQAELEKIPYVLVLGEREIKANAVNVRKRHAEEQVSMSTNEFVEKIKREIENKVT